MADESGMFPRSVFEWRDALDEQLRALSFSPCRSHCATPRRPRTMPSAAFSANGGKGLKDSYLGLKFILKRRGPLWLGSGQLHGQKQSNQFRHCHRLRV
jgi:hypothetical protein